MNKKLKFGVCLFSLFLACSSWAQRPRDAAVEVTAELDEDLYLFTLSWPASSRKPLSQRVARRIRGETNWNTLAQLDPSALSYVDEYAWWDNNYEYMVVRVFSTAPTKAFGYLSAGAHLGAISHRGRVIMLVEESLNAPLAFELQRLVEDLVGDGWMVVRRSVSRTDAVTSVKSTVQGIYNEDPDTTRSLILVGHVPVPYSGVFAPDAHADHTGAWPADVYYGDFDTEYTDTQANAVIASRAANRNVPGDGKFDQNSPDGDVTLEVGRIDLSNMSGVSNGLSETELTRQYLNRDHDYRFKQGAYADVPRRGLICDQLGYFGGEAFAVSGWRNFTNFFGRAPGAIVEGPWFPTLQNEKYLFAYGCGGGTYTSAYQVATSADFASKKSQAVFNLLFGSYFGDWDNADNLLRAPLAGNAGSLGLACAWSGRPLLNLYAMAMGDTIGAALKETQNNFGTSLTGFAAGNYGRTVDIALMGDPTLRLHMVTPVNNLRVSGSGDLCTISWTGPADGTDVYDYFLLRATQPEGPYEMIAEANIDETTYEDYGRIPGQTYYYMAKTVVLEQTPSGCYFNTSQGIMSHN